MSGATFTLPAQTGQSAATLALIPPLFARPRRINGVELEFTLLSILAVNRHYKLFQGQ